MNKDMKFGLLILLVCVLIFLGYPIIEHLVHTERERIESVVAASLCRDKGWQDSINNQDVFYCIDYGIEPRVQRIGTIDELKGF